MKKAKVFLAAAGLLLSCNIAKRDPALNSPPAIFQVDIGNGPFFKTSELTAIPLGWSDADGDKPDYRYQWTVNDAPIPEATGSTFSPAGLKKGDRVSCTVTPVDQFTHGDPVRSNVVQLAGSLPQITFVSIGGGPYYKGDPITVQARAFDDDSDSFTLHYAWYVNGEIVEGANGATLSGASLKRGDLVMARVIPTEVASTLPTTGVHTVAVAGAETSTEVPGVPVDSNVITVANTPPSTPAVVVGPSELSTAGTTLWATVTSESVDADGDNIHYVYDWYKNGELQQFPENSTAVPGAYVDGGDQWTVAVSASDNYDMGWAALAAGPTVLLAAGEKLGGAYHTCMRTAASTLIQCWGRNNFMQLGDGTTTNRVFPVTLAPGGTVNVNRIALGDYHTCVLLAGGAVRCWGRNDFGQLGRNNTTSPLGDTGTNVVGLPATVTEIVAGSAHTCALAAGAVYCWGANDQGQIGDNSTTNRIAATLIIGSGVSAISAGAERTCVVTSAGAVQCWGRDNYNSVVNLTPTTVAASGFSATAGSISVSGDWVCGRDATKVVKCFGAGFGNTPVVVSGAVGGTGTVSSSGTQLTFSSAQPFVVGTIVEVSGQKKTIASGAGTVWNTTSAFSPSFSGKNFTYYVAAKAESLVSGLSHTCMVASTTYALQCFGNNVAGQLGNGILSNLTSYEFTSALGFTGNAVAVGAGLNHTCGIKGSAGGAGGVLFCWGDNEYGQLGNGTSGIKERYPAGVGGWAVAIDGGNYNSCVVTESGNVKCWGDNTYGQIGDGTVTQRRTPVYVTDFDVVGNPNLSNVVSIAVGGYHACAILATGVTKCWGLNSNGQLGTGNTTNYNRAKAISGGDTFAMITAGYAHTCGIRTDGAVRCWGRNTWGAVGDGSVTDRNLPTAVALSGGGAAMSIAAGTGHTCAVKTDGTVQCWGANWSGQLGDNSHTNRASPVVVGAFTDAVRIATHDAHTCAQTRSRNTYCWGKNAGGQLGIGNQTEMATPQLVGSLNGISESIAVGYDHSCAMTVDGAMRCWGRNKDGEIGDGTTTLRNVPTSVYTLGSGGVIAIAAGGSHSCAIMNGGLVKCWGRNEVGEVGNNVSLASATIPRVTPVTPVGQGAGVTALGAGQNHTCDSVGGVPNCWGQGAEGQIGDGTYVTKYVPTPVAGAYTTVDKIRGGARATCARLTDGTLRCWGTGNAVGTWNGSSCPNGASPLSPVMSQGGPNTWDALAGNYEHFCARNTTNNGLICWGNNPFGQLGLGNTADQCLPQMAWNVRGNTETLRSGFVSIRGGDEHTCVMRDATGANPGLERCWGRGSEGQLGNGTGDQYNPSFSNAWNGVAIGTGGYHSCMVTNGAPWVWCWGWNYFGQVGDNSVTDRSGPVQTVGGAMTVLPTQMEGGYGHSCAVSNGNLYCWGWDNEYQIGLAKGANNCVPAASTCTTTWTGGCGCGVPGGYTCVANCASASQCKQNTDQWGCTGCQSCTLSYTCYPNSQYCALQPTLVLSGGVTALSTRDATTCVIQSNVAKCVGRNGDGQVGNGLNFTQVGPGFNNVAGLTGNALLIASGGRMTCVKDSASGAAGASPIKCVGNNSQGQLGRNTTGASTYSPAQVLDGSLPNNGLYVSQLVAGDNHVCALIGAGGSNSGWVYCWGDNSQGQMGRGSAGGSQARPWPVLDPYGPTVGGDDPAGSGYKVLDGVVALGAGRNHTCAYRNTGELTCWGYNSRGQVGNGGNASPQTWGQSPYFEHTVPVANTRGYGAELLPSNTSVAAGGTHTCFIMKNGRVRCMGDNDMGQLGTGEAFDYTVPRNVNATALNNAVAIAAGYRHTCAIQSGGTVYCWGENAEGQLGLNDRTNRSTPTLVSIAPDTATAIYAGYSHTCVLTAAGTAKCWGRNAERQIPSGTGTPPDLYLSPVPLQLAGVTITGMNELALGFGHTCYRVGAAVSCVGNNGYGQVGDSNGGTVQARPEDTSGNGGMVFTQVSVGDLHSCGVAGGAAYCWGSNDYGQLGDSTHDSHGRPTPVVGLSSGVSAVYAGAQSTCALKTDGTVYCWGANDYGQVGRSGAFIDAPVPVVLPTTATGLAVGAYHACAVLTGGKMQCWGNNYTGQVGAKSTTGYFTSPQYVVDVGNVQISTFASVSAGGYHTCAVTTVAAGSKLYCWGSNYAAQLGFDNADVGANFTYAKFVKDANLGADTTGVSAVSAGDSHTCMLKTDGTVWCWGSDLEGQIGDDVAFGGNVLSPTVVSGLSAAASAVNVSAGKNHSCAVRSNGSVVCWGANTDYQLGDGSTAVRQPTLVQVISLGIGNQNKVLKVSSGGISTCALDSVNNLRCWGDDTYGQVGVWGPRAVMQY